MRQARIRRGFTLIELLVVIGIIMLLIAILLPVVSQVRIRAYDTSTQNEMSRIMAACQMYYHDHNAYPGPIANAYLSGGAKAGADPSPTALPPIGGSAITSSENLVLGLFGFLTPPKAAATPPTITAPNPPATPPWTAPTHDVLSLNYLHPASYHYMDFIAEELSPGPASSIDYYSGQALTDTQIPEFVDHFPEHLPILYIRANTGNPPLGADGFVSGTTDSGWQYNYTELKDYGCSVRDNLGSSTWSMFTPALFNTLQTMQTAQTLSDDVASPYVDFHAYFLNPNISGTPRGKDTFILIGAGIDHIYGTSDDTLVTP